MPLLSNENLKVAFAMIHRREIILGTLACSLLPRTLSAKTDPIEITWADLVPDSGGTTMDELQSMGIVEHGQMSTGFDQETAGNLTTEFDGLTVRIPGYLLAMEFDGHAIVSGLLVPYVGACIHVPPPPPNQLIYLTLETPYESEGMFDPVYVTGVFGTAATATELADVGYALSAEHIEPYS